MTTGMKWAAIAIAVLAAVGFADATYLTVSHFAGTSLNCSFFAGCDIVTKSDYATLFGVPISIVGAAWYLVAFTLATLYVRTAARQLIAILVSFAALAFLFSAWLVWLQFYEIRALCLYCMGSALISTLIFVLSGIVFFKTKAAHRA